MKKNILLILIIIIVGVAVGLGIIFLQRIMATKNNLLNSNQNVTNGSATVVNKITAGHSLTDKANMIRVTNPKADKKITSPLTIEGEARGNWYFEATLPVKLVDAEGRDWAIGSVQAQGNWMTEDFVKFKGELKFEKPLTKTGKLILSKDNPSDLPEKADFVEVPVSFE